MTCNCKKLTTNHIFYRAEDEGVEDLIMQNLIIPEEIKDRKLRTRWKRAKIILTEIWEILEDGR